MSSYNTMSFRHRIKKSIVYGFGNKCYICGRVFSYKVYELHHINPSKKAFTFSCNTHSVNSVINEAFKCILVCPTCHRLITLEEIFIPNNLKSNFNKNKFIKVYDNLKNTNVKINGILTKDVLLRDLKHGMTINDISVKYKVSRNTVSKYCKVYKIKPKDYKSTLSKRISRNDLKDLIRNNPFTTIANEYNVTDNAIRKLCKKYNLPYKKSVINSIDEYSWKTI